MTRINNVCRNPKREDEFESMSGRARQDNGCLQADIDRVEYFEVDRRIVYVALIDFKRYFPRNKPPAFAASPQGRLLSDIATRLETPLFLVRYAAEESKWPLTYKKAFEDPRFPHQQENEEKESLIVPLNFGDDILCYVHEIQGNSWMRPASLDGMPARINVPELNYWIAQMHVAKGNPDVDFSFIAHSNADAVFRANERN